MDSFVDMKVATMYYHNKELKEPEDKPEPNGKKKKFMESWTVREKIHKAYLANEHSILHIRNTHRMIIDSIH